MERQQLGLWTAVRLSLAASAIACLAMSLALLLSQLSYQSPSDMLVAPMVLVLVLAVSMIFALPAGLIAGVPALMLLPAALKRRPIVFAMTLSLLGCALAVPINHYLDRSAIQQGDHMPWYLAWGAAVGGMHALMLGRHRRTPLRTLLLAFAPSLIAMPIVALSVAHAFQNAAAHRMACGHFVSELDPALALRADRAVQTGYRGTDRVTAQIGNWRRDEYGPSTAHAYSAIFVNGKPAIAIRDRAVMPQSLLTDLGLTSPVERRCTLAYAGPHAGLIRRIARPIDLHPPRWRERHPAVLLLTP